MRFEDVPRRVAVIGQPTDDVGVLTADLASVVGPSGLITHMEPIFGAPRSGRVLYQQMSGEAVALPRPMTPEMMAEELRILIGEARYSPEQNPGINKGMQIFSVLIGGRRAIIVWATWVNEQ